MRRTALRLLFYVFILCIYFITFLKISKACKNKKTAPYQKGTVFNTVFVLITPFAIYFLPLARFFPAVRRAWRLFCTACEV